MFSLTFIFLYVFVTLMIKNWEHYFLCMLFADQNTTSNFLSGAYACLGVWQYHFEINVISVVISILGISFQLHLKRFWLTAVARFTQTDVLELNRVDRRHMTHFSGKGGSKQFPDFPRRRFWWVNITALYQLTLQSWYQKTAQSLVDTLVLFLWHNRLP